MDVRRARGSAHFRVRGRKNIKNSQLTENLARILQG
jgi:hypothetical protein